jgi:hypothetical protein
MNKAKSPYCNQESNTFGKEKEKKLLMWFA